MLYKFRKILCLLVAAILEFSVLQNKCINTFANTVNGNEVYTESEVYYQDFSNIKFPTASVGSNNNLLKPGSFVNNAFESSDFVWSRTSKTANATVGIEQGKLKFTKDDAFAGNDDWNTAEDQIQNVYMKFDKAFDVSNAKTNKLYISYDIEPISANFYPTYEGSTYTNTRLWRALPAYISPIHYDAETNTITKTGKMQVGNGYKAKGTDVGFTYLAYGRTINATAADSGVVTDYTVNKAGMGVFMGDAWSGALTNDSYNSRTEYNNGYDAGIAFNALGTVYTVTYEITPAETADGFAKLSKVTISDGIGVVAFSDFTANGTDLAPLTNNTISGIDFCMSPMMTATIDNVKVYYEGTEVNGDEDEKNDSYEGFSVIQSAGMRSRENIGGFSLLADFKDGNPGKVYFKCIRGNATNGSLFEGTCLAQVINPAGEVVVLYDFSDMTSFGDSREVVLEIPDSEAMEGVWSFRFSSSFTGNDGVNSDIGTIGLVNPLNWGVRGEYLLHKPSYSNDEAWIYVPEKVDKLFVASSDANYPITLYNADNSLLGQTTQQNSAWFGKSIYQNEQIAGENVYRLDLLKDGDGEIPYSITIDYAPSLICPTKEMALALKGGWETTSDGVLVQGSLQNRARNELLRLYEKYGDLEVFLDVKDEQGNIIKDENNGYFKTPDLDLSQKTINGEPYNSERTFAYIARGPRSNVLNYINKQNMNVRSPYFGSFEFGESENDSALFEQGLPCVLVGTGENHTASVFSSVINLDNAYNPFYQSRVLALRQALFSLAMVVSLSEDMIIRDNAISTDGAITHGQFSYRGYAEDYMLVRDLLDSETVEILDEAMRQITYNMGTMFGRGPTNQWLYVAAGTMFCYYATHDEIIKDIYYRHLEALIREHNGGRGLSPGGYFIENYGCDGSYHGLSRTLTYTIYKTAKKMESNNPYISGLKKVIERNLEFGSLFITPQVGGSAYGVNAPTSRTEMNIDDTGHVTYSMIFDEFPLAMREYEFNDVFRKPYTVSETIRKYGNVYDWRQDVKYNSINEYEALTNYDEGKAVSSVLFPSEQEYGIWEFDKTAIAVKNRGLYLNVFYSPYGNDVPDNSYMGGGITSLYADNVGVIMSSRKPVDHVENTDYKMHSYDDILSTCIIGMKEDGSYFYTGKEISSIEWVEENTKFKIGGTTKANVNNLEYNDVDVEWIYELTDNGISMTAGASDCNKDDVVSNISEAWVNIPISYMENENVSIECEEGRLLQSYRGAELEITWDENLEHYLASINGGNGEIYHCLRIKLPASGYVDIDIKNLSSGFYPEVYVSEHVITGNDSATTTDDVLTVGNNVNVSVDVTNQRCDTRDVLVFLAAYDEGGELLDCFISEQQTIEWYDTQSQRINGVCLPAGTNKVTMFFFENLQTLKPYIGKRNIVFK